MTAENQNVTSNMDDEETVKAPVGLVILVVVLGIAIVGMLGLMAYKIMSGDASKPKKTEIPVVATEVRVAADMELGDMTITKPAGSKLSKIETNANSIILHYQSDAKVTLIVIDRVTGKESHIVAPE